MKRQKRKVLYKNLKPFDLVVVGNRGFVPAGIKFFTTKFKERNKDGRENLAVHIAIIIDIRGQLVLAEMLTKGLKLTSLEKYNTGKRRKPYIIDIIRPINRNELDPHKIVDAQCQIINDFRHQLEYDFKGDLKFVFKRIKESKEKAFCSEYASKWWRFIGVKVPFTQDYFMSPRDFQTDIETKKVKWF